MKTLLKELRFYTIAFIVSICLAIGLRVFVIAPLILIPTGSMEPTVLSGDIIIVTKLIPGPRVNKDIRQIRIDGKVQTKRLKGIRTVRRNDVIVFNYPYSIGSDEIDMDLNVFYLKRCIALPGDTFSIKDGIYKVNNCLDSIGCIFRQKELYQKKKDDFPEATWQCFPFDTEHYQWNIKDFGPLFVPASGSTIDLDTFNIILYKNLIEYETNKWLSVRNDAVFLGGERINTYSFKLNYYFMAGDNIFDSHDSRYWGLLPEDCIVGKAIFVWKSTMLYDSKIRCKRFLKKII